MVIEAMALWASACDEVKENPLENIMNYSTL
jgi:hypothetical protein